MNLRFLETFIWVARLSSFSGAAKKLHATQATVSNRISVLECSLGVRLFDRDLKSVCLTPEGRQALSRAEQLVRLANEFVESVSNGSAFSGMVTIGTIDSVVLAWLPKLIDRISQNFPRIACNLIVETSARLEQYVNAGDIDIGILLGPISGEGIENVMLGRFACRWIASPSLRLPEGSLTLAELGSCPIISYPKESKSHHELMKLLASEAVGEGRIYNSNSITTIIRLVADGIGIAPVPTISVSDLLRSGVLVSPNIASPFPDMIYHAVYRKRPDMPLPALIAKLASEITADFANG